MEDIFEFVSDLIIDIAIEAGVDLACETVESRLVEPKNESLG